MIYLFALCAVGILTLLLYWKMPRSVQQSSTFVSYLDSLKSLPHLVASQRLLREAAVSGFFMFGTFSIFWSTLIFYISSPAYNWGTFEAGILAILGCLEQSLHLSWDDWQILILKEKLYIWDLLCKQ